MEKCVDLFDKIYLIWYYNISKEEKYTYKVVKTQFNVIPFLPCKSKRGIILFPNNKKTTVIKIKKT